MTTMQEHAGRLNRILAELERLCVEAKQAFGEVPCRCAGTCRACVRLGGAVGDLDSARDALRPLVESLNAVAKPERT